MNTLAFAVIIVLIWLVVVGIALSILVGMTRYAMRMARAAWPLSPKVWSVLVIGETTQAIGILSFSLAALVDGLMLQLPIEWILQPLLVLRFLGIYLGSMVLVIWLSLVVLVRDRTTPLDALFGRDRRRTALALVVAVLGSGMLGYAVVNTWAQPWLVGCVVAVPVGLNLVCLYSLSAHTSAG
jgi:hypothetical protein